MALDLQAILNEAVSEVLEKKEEETKESVEEAYSLAERTKGEENKEELLEKVKKGAKEVQRRAEDATKEARRKLEDIKDKLTGEDGVVHKGVKTVKRGLEDARTAVSRAAEDHPYAAAATGALAAGAGALGLRKMIKKRGGLKK